MANSVSERVGQRQERKATVAWAGFVLASAVMLGAGALLATQISGVARPWTGLALAIAAGLAAIVGASKTSSA